VPRHDDFLRTSLAHQTNAVASAGGEGGRGGALAVAGTKRKKGSGGRGGSEIWSPRGDGPSHGPVHSFATRNTGVFR